MKLSISNIAWDVKQDIKIYELMQKLGYSGLEIAPTRIFPKAPYTKIVEAKGWSKELKETYGFGISSIQSIWYGRQENIFGTAEEKQILINYTKKAIDFASAIGCGNLVFGCPRNRNLPEGANISTAISFFEEIGDYANKCGTVIGMEANPRIYNTNYINDTQAALELIRKVNSPGFLLNLDIGTMIYNEEDMTKLSGKVQLINHIHISEPGLNPIKRRDLHKKLFELLKKEGYDKYISIEMGMTDDISIIESTLIYIRDIFG